MTCDDLDLLAEHEQVDSWSDLGRRGLVSLERDTHPETSPSGFWRPRLRFRTSPWKMCPYLINQQTVDGRWQGLCSIHAVAKPLICRLSPWAREVTEQNTTWTEVWSIQAPVDGCPGFGRGESWLPEPDFSLRRRLDREVLWMRLLRERTASLTEPAAIWNCWQAIGAELGS